MNPDFINGLFEALAGIMVFLHCRRLLIDKQVRGSSTTAVAFFTAWGFWNLYYYPHLNQIWSLIGAIVVVTANVICLLLMLKYRKA